MNIFVIDFDDIIQYHARNLYELFYKRKGQQRSYSCKKRSQKRNRLTPNEIKEKESITDNIERETKKKLGNMTEKDMKSVN